MLTRDAETGFLSFLADRALALAGTDALTAATAMIDWYETTRADDALHPDLGGDTIALSWGKDQSAGVSWFEYGITRRLTRPGPEGIAVWQLALRCRFEPSELTAALGTGTESCASPAALAAFRAAVSGSLLAVFARFAEPAVVETRFWPFRAGYRATTATPVRELADADAAR